MEDDVTFGSSVWSANADANTEPFSATLRTPSPIPHATSPNSSQDQFDDFDDFLTPPQTDQTDRSVAQDDDFGDFGDFGEAQQASGSADFGDEASFGDVPVAGPSQVDWKPLKLDPLPSIEQLEKQIDEILGPIWADDISDLTTDEGIREVEGISQILVTPASRELYNSIINSPPLLEPVNWTRSRIRQQHLISLGIPVNLDEVLPHANGKPLPPLQINTRPMSAPPGPRHEALKNGTGSRSNSRGSSSRAGTPQPSSQTGSSIVSQPKLEPPPTLDENKITELLSLDPDQLTLQSISRLEHYLAALRSETTNASSLLTHLLLTRDALEQDSETYHKLIKELVSEAQKTKTGKGRTSSRK